MYMYMCVYIYIYISLILLSLLLGRLAVRPCCETLAVTEFELSNSELSNMYCICYIMTFWRYHRY